MTELTDLVGAHVLSGVDRQTIHADYDDAEQINFVLDGVTYTATQDPSDGYRSTMQDILISDAKVINNFPDVQVMGKMRDNERGREHDVLELYDTVNGKLILAIGTEDTDDYYPWWVADFNPENIHYNQETGG